MNVLIAILVGVLGSYALLRKNGDHDLGWWRPIAGASGAFIPYLQAFFALFGSGFYWQIYMGPTWSLLLVPPLASAMAIVLARISKHSFVQLVWPVGVGMVGTILLALLTEQGAFPLAILLNLRIALSLLHSFQQCRLHFGRCTVDLISQNEIGKNGPFSYYEFITLLIIDECTDNVCGEKVGCKLYPAEPCMNSLGQ